MAKEISALSVEKLLDSIKENCKLIGNLQLLRIIEENESLDNLSLALSLYNTKLEISEEKSEEENSEDEEGEIVEKKKIFIRYLFYIDGICLDPSNIGKISLHQEYNVRYKQMEFLLIVNPKYANGIEGENLYFKFKTEEERDFWFDVLKKKLKNLQTHII